MRAKPPSRIVVALAAALSACGGVSRSGPAPDPCPQVDADGDCQAPFAEGGEDCDDADPSMHAGAADNGPGESFRSELIRAWTDLPYPFCWALDPTGALHLLSVDGSGFYTTNRSGRWETTTLSQAAFEADYCVLFVDRSGVHLLYGDQFGAGPLLYANHPGLEDASAPFSRETVAADLSRILSVQLWRSANGRLWGAFLDEGRGVKVAERTDQGWVVEHVGSLPGWGSLALSGSHDGEPWLLTNRLRDIFAEPFFSERSAGAWAERQLAVDATSWMNLAIARHHGGAPELLVQYSRHGNYGPAGRFSRVEYHTRRGETWESTVVDAEFWVDCMDIGLDGRGRLRAGVLGHADQTEGAPRELRIYEQRAGGWLRTHRTELDHLRLGSVCSVYLDSAGAVTVVAPNDEDELRQVDNRSTPDGIDQNCDGVDGVDADGDGLASRATGGSDDDE
jgi:hypothetical protein